MVVTDSKFMVTKIIIAINKIKVNFFIILKFFENIFIHTNDN